MSSCQECGRRQAEIDRLRAEIDRLEVEARLRHLRMVAQLIERADCEGLTWGMVSFINHHRAKIMWDAQQLKAWNLLSHGHMVCLLTRSIHPANVKTLKGGA